MFAFIFQSESQFSKFFFPDLGNPINDQQSTEHQLFILASMPSHPDLYLIFCPLDHTGLLKQSYEYRLPSGRNGNKHESEEIKAVWCDLLYSLKGTDLNEFSYT